MINDDSKQVIKHYKTSGDDAYDIIKDLMERWSRVLKTNIITDEDATIFTNAIQEKNESIWFEIGSRLALLWDRNDMISDIFSSTYNNKSTQAKFNIVALGKYLPNIFLKDVLKDAINNKSNKVRLKVADIILTLQDESLLSILNDRLKIEENKKVIDGLNFTVNNFHKVRKNKDGSITFTVS